MKKVGIMTIVNYDNYGNKLQNYATQEIIKKMGYEAETLVNEGKYKKLGNLLKLHGIRFFDRYPRIKMKEVFQEELYKKKVARFKEFTKEYINETSFEISIDNIEELDHNDYYKFVVGSDQIWNPNFRSGGNPNDFLCYAPKTKRIAFSPSIGVSKLSEAQEKKYSKWLNEMEFLSCREQEGAQLITKLTGRNVEVLVDPTMVIESDQWIKFSKKQRNKTKNKYLLTYFLGPLSEEYRNKLEKIAKEKGLEIVNLYDRKNTEVYIANPCEWVDYVKDAELFCTDSFHGVVFSILMKTPFIVFNRGGKVASMSSRIDTILSKFRFEERRAEKIFVSNKIFDIAFEHCDEILEKERKKSITYLKRALDS